LLSVEKMEKRLKAAITISDDHLMRLAEKRGKAVMDHILGNKKIEKERSFMLDPTIGSAKEAANISRNRVEFILK